VKDLLTEWHSADPVRTSATFSGMILVQVDIFTIAEELY
jgi:hypothetical protein